MDDVTPELDDIAIEEVIAELDEIENDVTAKLEGVVMGVVATDKVTVEPDSVAIEDVKIELDDLETDVAAKLEDIVLGDFTTEEVVSKEATDELKTVE